MVHNTVVIICLFRGCVFFQTFLNNKTHARHISITLYTCFTTDICQLLLAIVTHVTLEKVAVSKAVIKLTKATENELFEVETISIYIYIIMLHCCYLRQDCSL